MLSHLLRYLRTGCLLYFTTLRIKYTVWWFLSLPLFSPFFSLVANLPDWFLQVGLFAAACANTPPPRFSLTLWPRGSLNFTGIVRPHHTPEVHANEIYYDLLGRVCFKKIRQLFLRCTWEKLNIFVKMMYLRSNSKLVLCLCHEHPCISTS